MKNPGRDCDALTPAGLPEPGIDNLLDVVLELTLLMRQENEFLRSGMPAALSDLSDRKEKLTERLRALTRVTTALAGFAESEEEAAMKRHLSASGAALGVLTRENMKLLEGAMSASRRRIESVMQAIRAHEGISNGAGKGSADFRISTVKFEV